MSAEWLLIFRREMLRKLGKIQSEHWCGDYKLNNHEVYLNIPMEEALDCFEFGKAPDTKLTPKIEYEKKDVKFENVIGKNDTECFIIDCITLNGGECKPNITDSYGIYIVTDGDGVFFGENYSKPIKKEIISLCLAVLWIDFQSKETLKLLNAINENAPL